VGTDFLAVLDTTQKALVTGLTDIQRNDLYTRRLISTQLRRFMTESSVDSATVLALAKRYGELDGEIVYNYANNFVNVSKTMTTEQKAKLLPILSKYSWDRIACTGAYLYSEKLSAMPDIDGYGTKILSSCLNNDYFFTTDTDSGVSNGTITKIYDGFTFTEGPAADASGNVFFSDITANNIYKWSTAGQLTTFKTNTGGINGLFFDKSGNLIACQGTDGKLVSIDSSGNVTTLAATYNGVRFNEPNDLWVDLSGGVYFSDPLYFGTTLYQGGQYVYYLNPAHTTVIRVISDMTQPNGLIGTADGKMLYVADYGAGMTYKY